MADKEQAAPAPEAEADEKGVPFANRMKEMERKLAEKYDKELAATRQELEQIKASMRPQETNQSTNSDELTKAELMEFVKAPTGFLAKKFQEFKTRDEMSQVLPWVSSQKGYTEEDKERLIQIENEYGLGHPSPMDRTKAAWKILQQEKAAGRVSSNSEESNREARVNQNSTEGSGKATPKQAPVTRRDIIKKLAAAEASGDLDASIRYTSLLEDVRE